jgi:hypothetical protein
VSDARNRWIAEAQAVVDEGLDAEQMDRLRAEATEKLAELREEIDAINDALRVDAGQFDLPAVPEAMVSGSDAHPLLDSEWSFAERCRALIDSKAYRNGGPS